MNILIQALDQFEGTFIVVSHDRYLLDNVANKIWFIEDQAIKEYPGSYAEYEEWQSKRVVPLKKEEPVKKAEVKESKPKVVSEDKNKELKKLHQALEKLEKDIAELESGVQSAEAELAKEEVYNNPEKLSEANRVYQQINPRLLKAQQEWERLVEEIMAQEK